MQVSVGDWHAVPKTLSLAALQMAPEGSGAWHRHPPSGCSTAAWSRAHPSGSGTTSPGRPRVEHRPGQVEVRSHHAPVTHSGPAKHSAPSACRPVKTRSHAGTGAAEKQARA
ncbi:MAG: hypothetical protein ABTQ32_07780, partial [Myxococcaceae bacterium]